MSVSGPTACTFTLDALGRPLTRSGGAATMYADPTYDPRMQQ